MTEELKSRGDRKKQEEFYYLERGQMNINGCCTYSEGYYCGYHNSRAIGLEMQAWASSKTAKNALRQLNKVKSQFAVQQQRSRVGDIVDALYNEDAPFEYTYRFDLFNTYILVGKFAAVIDQITSAASYKEKREDEKGDAVTIPISERKDLKRPDAGNQDWKFNDAQQQFNKGVREFEEMLSNGIWTYTRNRFENEVKILWCAGPPKCPQPKEDKECGPGPNGTKCPKPPPCEGTEYYARDLKKFLDAANPRGRKSDEWYINVFDNMNPNCQQLEDLTNVKNLLSNFKISSKGFLFSKRNKTEGDEKVHRILYDLNSEEYKDYKNIICPTSETTDDN